MNLYPKISKVSTLPQFYSYVRIWRVNKVALYVQPTLVPTTCLTLLLFGFVVSSFKGRLRRLLVVFNLISMWWWMVIVNSGWVRGLATGVVELAHAIKAKHAWVSDFDESSLTDLPCFFESILESWLCEPIYLPFWCGHRLFISVTTFHYSKFRRTCPFVLEIAIWPITVPQTVPTDEE